MTTEAPNRGRDLTYLVSFVLLGICLTIAGPALSHLAHRVGTNDAGIGLVFVGQSVGYLFGATLGGRMADRGAAHRTWSVSMVVVLASFMAIAVERNLALMVATFAIYGVANAVGDASGNTLVVWSRPQGGGLLSALHLAFAIGALCTPLLANRALAWSGNLLPMAVPIGALTVLCIALLARYPAPTKTREIAAPQPSVGGLDRRRWQLITVCAFFTLYVALETGFFGWIHTYVERIGYGDANTATGVTATFWVGFVFGRLLSVWMAHRFEIGQVLAGSVAAAVAAAVAFMFVHGPGTGLWVVTFVFAVAQAPQFAAMIGYAERHFVLSGKAASAFIVSAGLGGLVMPWLIGRLFESQGPYALPPTMLVAAIGTALAALAVRAMVVRQEVDQRPPLTSMNAPVT